MALANNLRRSLAMGTVTTLLFGSGPAAAFCRTTTCDPKVDGDCLPDPVTGCVPRGIPLSWGTPCIAYGVHEGGSVRQGISAADAVAVAQAAFRTWLTADCGAGSPSLSVWDLSVASGPVTCGHPEFNACAPNANVILFRDDEWHHDGDNILAYTNVTFVPSTGQILDADIEVNAVTSDLTLTGEPGQSDFQSLLTHEVGHFLGLDHTRVPDATMVHALFGTTEMRSLEPDDVLGVCTVYPPGSTEGECSSPQLVHGFTRSCVQSAEEAADDSPGTRSCSSPTAGGCSCILASPHPRGDDAAVAAGVAALAVLRRRLRSRGRARREPDSR